MTENTGRKQEKGRFQKGVSGNPSGKPKGARHRATLLAESLLANEVQDICAAVVAEAKKGNMQAAKIVLDRLLPSRKDCPITLELLEMQTGSDLSKAMACIVNAVASGKITPSEGEAVASIINIHAKTIELVEFEQRLIALETKSS